ncbi:MAG: exodeoxyribonuclease VII large subunit [Bacteroidaceae bacterium]|nr:exodeoxyribonuclease VII large subunit [Bacteroidaceae bacterium]
MSQPLSLLQFNSLVSEAIDARFERAYPVVAEVSELRMHTAGHCYLTFIEKGAGGTIVAKAPAHIWRTTAQRLLHRFRTATGRQLAAGMSVLVTVEPELHVQYGYSLNVIDIDPTYTLGAQAAQRQATIDALKADGVFDMNRELPLPRPVRAVAVVSSDTAAGYGDFCRQLEQSGYPFEVELFAAIVQGAGAPASICAALADVAARADEFDVCVVIRGGGAVSDLMCFDSREVAEYICQMPLPVLTGIGHERDETVADLVAHRALKTPTAVAALLVDLRAGEAQLVSDLALRLRQSATLLLQSHSERLVRTRHALQLAAAQIGTRERTRLSRLSASVVLGRRALIAAHTRRLASLSDSLRLLDPQRILARGFSLTTSGGHVVRNAADLAPGAEIVTRLASGELRSTVTRIVNKEE